MRVSLVLGIHVHCIENVLLDDKVCLQRIRCCVPQLFECRVLFLFPDEICMGKRSSNYGVIRWGLRLLSA